MQALNASPKICASATMGASVPLQPVTTCNCFDGGGHVLQPKHPRPVNIRVAQCVLCNPVTVGDAKGCKGACDSTSESVDEAMSAKPMSPSHNECGGAAGFAKLGVDDDEDEDAVEVDGRGRHLQR